jgi:hypothetical protein
MGQRHKLYGQLEVEGQMNVGGEMDVAGAMNVGGNLVVTDDTTTNLPPGQTGNLVYYDPVSKILTYGGPPPVDSQWVDITGGIEYEYNVGIGVNLSRITDQYPPSNVENNFTISNYETLNQGAVIYRNLGVGPDIVPLVNGNTYYVKKLTGLTTVGGFIFPNNQVGLYSDPSLTLPISVVVPAGGSHYLDQSNRTLTNTIVSNQNFQIDDGLFYVNAKPYKTGDVNWISPKNNWEYGVIDNEGTFQAESSQTLRTTTLLIGPYYEFNTNPCINTDGIIMLHSNSSAPFMGLSYGGFNYGILGNLNLKPAGTNDITTGVGGYYSGMGIISFNNSSDTLPSFGVLAKNQSGNGRGSVNFTVYNNKVVNTFNNVLDNGSGNLGINCTPSELLHVRQLTQSDNTVLRIDNNSANNQAIGSTIRFIRGGQGVIAGASLLGRLDYQGASAGTDITNYTYTQGASIDVRAISGSWSTATNRSAQFMFFTRHQNTYAERMRLTSDGNLLLNTTTNGTFRLDVNGTARVQNALTLGSLSADPSGTNGMIYYNTTSNTFRVFQNGAWRTITTT